MKTLRLIIFFTMSALMVSCGKQGTEAGSSNYYLNFINAHNGVDFKDPSKINVYQSNFTTNSYSGDILVSLDNNGSFYIRSEMPFDYSGDEEMEGVRGTWEVDNGYLELYKDGKKVATSKDFPKTTNTNETQLSLNFIRPLGINMVSVENTFNPFGNGVTLNSTVVPISGIVTIEREI